MEEAGERRRHLGAVLRELNREAGLGVAEEDLERVSSLPSAHAMNIAGDASRLEGRARMWFEYGTVNLGNLTGAPALSLPCGFTPDGLPVGLQLYGRAFDEARLLSFAHTYEQGTEWHRRRPVLD
jgi:Asp-tRNA(Asn)/Glu-tRNA(Gln) amidotransferase A subunit family amidase